jgi:hypothetical protein
MEQQEQMVAMEVQEGITVQVVVEEKMEVPLLEEMVLKVP